VEVGRIGDVEDPVLEAVDGAVEHRKESRDVQPPVVAEREGAVPAVVRSGRVDEILRHAAARSADEVPRLADVVVPEIVHVSIGCREHIARTVEVALGQDLRVERSDRTLGARDPERRVLRSIVGKPEEVNPVVGVERHGRRDADSDVYDEPIWVDRLGRARRGSSDEERGNQNQSRCACHAAMLHARKTETYRLRRCDCCANGGMGHQERSSTVVLKDR
jgi:hypothetical protein